MLEAIKTFFKQLFCSHNDFHNDDYCNVCSNCGEVLSFDDEDEDDDE